MVIYYNIASLNASPTVVISIIASLNASFTTNTGINALLYAITILIVVLMHH